MNRFDFLVFIGRFQPFHQGHFQVVQAGLSQADSVIILCGSAHGPRSLRNPWSHDEREAMIRGCFNAQDNKRLIIAPLMDATYNDDAWVRNIQMTVQGLVTAHFPQPHKTPRIGLIGHNKDKSSYYLNLFPQWDSVAVENVANLNATTIRQTLLSPSCEDQTRELATMTRTLPAAVCDYLDRFCGTADYRALVEEQGFVNKYKAGWAKAPYAPTFVTVDSVVVQSGHILLIERKAFPGKGQWALPGGFVDQGERLEDAAIRELREETRLKVPEPVLRGAIKSVQVFDDPYRSARGRTITHAYLIHLRADQELPKVKGGDDAKAAFWVPLADLEPTRMFEDHYFIIQKMLGAA